MQHMIFIAQDSTYALDRRMRNLYEKLAPKTRTRKQPTIDQDDVRLAVIPLQFNTGVLCILLGLW